MIWNRAFYWLFFSVIDIVMDQIGFRFAILLSGATASGKSSLSVCLGDFFRSFSPHGFECVIVNADSMQIYEDLRILTARPCSSEMGDISHLLYGYVPASTFYSVGMWLDDIKNVLEDIWSRGAIPIITGGTGLYFHCLEHGLSTVPDIPASIRSYWRARGLEEGAESLYGILRDRDIGLASLTSRGDMQRITRGLEVLDATGRSLTDWWGDDCVSILSDVRYLRIVLCPPRAILRVRVSDRFSRMISLGAIEEVRAFLSLGIDPHHPLMKAYGVREIGSYLRGDMDLPAAISQSVMHTCRYIKRQETWFRNRMVDWNFFSDASQAHDFVACEWKRLLSY